MWWCGRRFLLVLTLAGCGRREVICEASRVGHVRYFGYFEGARFHSETASYSNLRWGLPEEVFAVGSSGDKAVVEVADVFQVASATRPSDDAIARRWRAASALLLPHIDAIAAVYAADEPYWNGVRNGVPLLEIARRLEEAARLIHATPGFEGLPVATIFANAELDWIAEGSARNPDGYEWVGWDLYGAPTAVTAARADLFLSITRPEQRVIAIPDAFLWNDQRGEIFALMERIAFWVEWIQSHPVVIAVTPFVYQSNTDLTGARELPSIRERYAGIGACILAAQGAPSP